MYKIGNYRNEDNDYRHDKQLQIMLFSFFELIHFNNSEGIHLLTMANSEEGNYDGVQEYAWYIWIGYIVAAVLTFWIQAVITEDR